MAAFQVGRFAAGGSAMATGWATSSDAGRTWRSGVLPGVAGARVTDPAVAFDAAHGQWLVATLINGANVSAIGVNRSRDGRSWSAPVFAVHLPFATITFDKEWIACDNSPTSPFFGSCYLVHTERNLFTPRLAFQSSHDGGATWSDPVAATSAFGSGVLGALPLVQPDGTLTIAFNAADGMHAVRSTDGGMTFATPVAIAPEVRAAPLPVRAPTLPAGAVDAAGRIYVVWADCRADAGCNRNSVVVSTSADGMAWSTPAPVARALDAFVPGVAAGAAGRLAVVTYVRSSSGSYGVAATTSRDAGATWTAPRRLDAVSPRFGWIAEADGGRFVGDYLGAAFAGGRLVPVFVLAQRPAGASLREYIAAASLPAP